MLNGDDSPAHKDARLRRLTRYRYNDVPLDANGRHFYVKDGDTVWNPGFKPTRTPLDFYECRHGFGYTKIAGAKNGVRAARGEKKVVLRAVVG